MISFLSEGQRFQMRAAAVCIHEDHVLLHQFEGESFWALPGGRVEAGEEAAQTVRREMAEELQLSVEVERLGFVVENFFSYQGTPHHEIGFYFLVRLPDGVLLSRKGEPHIGREAQTKLLFRWFPLEALGAIDLKPSFLRACLAAHDFPLQHVVHRDEPSDVRHTFTN